MHLIIRAMTPADAEECLDMARAVRFMSEEEKRLTPRGLAAAIGRRFGPDLPACPAASGSVAPRPAGRPSAERDAPAAP